MKLNLGCGKDYLKGYVNCDNVNTIKVDRNVDLEKPLDFPDSCVNEIIIYHTLEHIKNFIPLMEEFYRICNKGATIKIRVPYFANYGAFQDPTHTRFFTFNTFNYFSDDLTLNYYTTARFKTIKKRLTFSVLRPTISKPFDFFINRYPRLYEKMFSRILPAEQLEVHLVKV